MPNLQKKIKTKKKQCQKICQLGVTSEFVQFR